MNYNQMCYKPRLVPPRRKVGKTHGSISGIYPFRGTTGVAFESTLERDFLKRWELVPMVCDVESHPFTIVYWDREGKEREYTPDYLVSFDQTMGHQTPLLIEVKPLDRIKKQLHEWKERYRAAISLGKEEGFQFKLVSEAQ